MYTLEYYLKIVDEAAQQSGDTSMKVGALIVDSNGEPRTVGYNDFPQGVVESDSRRARPDKYVFTEHAERNAIFGAAYFGYATKGCTMYQRWFPCAECARAIVQCGITTLYCEQPNWEDARWGDSHRNAKMILEEGGVAINFYG